MSRRGSEGLKRQQSHRLTASFGTIIALRATTRRFRHRRASFAVKRSLFSLCLRGYPTKEHPMSDLGTYRDIAVGLDGNVATVEIRRPPHNFFDSDLIAQIGEAF